MIKNTVKNETVNDNNRNVTLNTWDEWGVGEIKKNIV